MGDRETILGEIARQLAVVERLDREREQARERLRALEASLGDDTGSTVAATSPATSAEKIALFLGVDAKAIGQVGGGKRCATGWVDVAMIQSLLRGGEVDESVTHYGHVVVDECHHLPAVSFERVLTEVRARFVLGLTATPYRRDGHQPIIHMQCGPVRYVVDPRSDGVRRPFVHRLISRQTSFRMDACDPDAGIQGLYAALARDEGRNELILNHIIAAVDE